MEDDQLHQIVVNTAVDFLAASVAPKKWAALRALNSYGKLSYAAAHTLPPLLVFSGVLSISQVPARQLEIDPHVPAQTQNSGWLETPRTILAASTSGGSDVSVELRGNAMTSSLGQVSLE